MRSPASKAANDSASNSVKSAFALPPGSHYLNCAYIGPISRQTAAAGIEGVQKKSFPAQITTADFFERSESVRACFAQLIHSEADRVALIPAVSYGVATVLRQLRFKRGQNVVVPAEEFPSNVNELRHRCHREGVQLRVVPRPADAQRPAARWSADMQDAIDAETALVLLSSVHWTDGLRFNLEQIAQRARAKSALFVVDGTQSTGACPFDFQAIAPDALITASYKFLLGPYTLGLMVLGDRLLESEPLEHNWKNRKHSEDFTRLIDYQDEFQAGARRHDFGEHSSTILVPMLESSLKQLLHWDVSRIATHCADLFAQLRETLAGSKYTVLPAGEQHGHLFGIGVPEPAMLGRLTQELAAAEVHVSLRGAALRVSTHIYNEEADVTALTDVLQQLAQR